MTRFRAFFFLALALIAPAAGADPETGRRRNGRMNNSLMLLDSKGQPGFQFLVRELKREDGRVVGLKSGVRCCPCASRKRNGWSS